MDDMIWLLGHRDVFIHWPVWHSGLFFYFFLGSLITFFGFSIFLFCSSSRWGRFPLFFVIKRRTTLAAFPCRYHGLVRSITSQP